MKSNNLKNNLLVVLSIAIILILTGIGLWIIPTDNNGLPDVPTIPKSFNGSFSEIGNFTLDAGWQLVSMPDNINKTDIYINYNEDTYTWNDAVNSDLIANVIFEYTNSSYIETNYLLRTRGYWMYCFADGITVSEMPSVLYVGNLYTGYENASNVTCSKVIIAPELYDDLYCNTFVATDWYEFYYIGGEVLQGVI